MRKLLNRLFGWRYVVVSDRRVPPRGLAKIHRAYRGECGWVLLREYPDANIPPQYEIVFLYADGMTSHECLSWAPWVGWGEQVPKPAPDEFVEWRAP